MRRRSLSSAVGISPILTEGILSTILWWYNLVGLTFVGDKIRIHWGAKVALCCWAYSCLFILIGIVKERNDWDKVFEGFSVLTFCAMALLKVISMMRNKYPNWYYLLKTLNDVEEQQLNFKPPPVVDYESDEEIVDVRIKFKDCINKYTNRYHAVLNVFLKIYFATFVIYVSAPYMEFALLKYRKIESIKKPHIFPALYPFEDIHFILYAAAVVIEFVAALYVVLVHVTFDATTIGLCVFSCAQFCLLRNYSQTIGGKGDTCNVTEKRDNRAHYRIVQCHKLHKTLTKTIKVLNSLLRNLMGLYFIIETLTVCTTAAKVDTVVNVVQLLTWVQYLSGILFQLFIFCYYGNQIFFYSSIGMGEGPYGSAYWCLSARIRKELSILAFGMSRPRRLMAGPFLYVNLNSFVQILRAAYSYYAVIRK